MTLLAAAAIWAAAPSCSRRQSPPTPRPAAYPRPAIYPEEMRPLEGAPIKWEVCAEAITSVSVRPDGTVWADVAYPAYRATLHITFTPDGSAYGTAMLDERRRRMADNLGAAQASARTVSTESVEAEITTALDACPTPLQFIATAGGRLISGALTFASPTPAPPDSIHPIVTAVEADLLRALGAL